MKLLIFSTCAKGRTNPDRAFVFASTSPQGDAGRCRSGLLSSSSPANLRWYLGRAGKRTIGPDKLNQLRHVRFLKNEEGLRRHMDAHRALLAPKFDAVIAALESRLAGTGVAQWTRPEGGYFVSVDIMEGTAKTVVDLARQVGLALTPAGLPGPSGVIPRIPRCVSPPPFRHCRMSVTPPKGSPSASCWQPLRNSPPRNRSVPVEAPVIIRPERSLCVQFLPS